MKHKYALQLAMFLLGLFVACAIVLNAYAWEISAAYCPDVWRTDWQSGGLDHNALEVELRQTIKPPWYGAISLRRLHATLTYPHDIDGQWFQGNETTLDISLRCGMEHKLIGPIYGDLFGGFGYMFDQRQPEFGDSGVLAHFGAMLVVKGERWKVGYGLAHYSDPTQHGDMGRNYQVLMVGFMW